MNTTSSCRILALEFTNEIPRRSLQQVLPVDPAEAIRIDPLTNPALLVGPQPLTDQAAHWIARSLPDNGPLLVVAYCSGAALAQEIAEAWPGPGAVLLLDPVAFTADVPQMLLKELAQKLDPDVDLGAVPDLRGAAPDEAFARGRVYLLDVLGAVAPDLPQEVAENLAGKQLAWFSYGVAVAHHNYRVSRPARVFLSTGVPLAQPWAQTTVEQCPRSQSELFTDAAVRLAAEQSATELASPVLREAL